MVKKQQVYLPRGLWGFCIHDLACKQYVSILGVELSLGNINNIFSAKIIVEHCFESFFYFFSSSFFFLIPSIIQEYVLILGRSISFQ